MRCINALPVLLLLLLLLFGVNNIIVNNNNNNNKKPRLSFTLMHFYIYMITPPRDFSGPVQLNGIGAKQPSQMFLTWVKARPQHRELRALLFTDSVWFL